jgi:hypothetical protein
MDTFLSSFILSFEVSGDINGIFMEEGGMNGGFYDERTNIYSKSIAYC